MSEPAIDISQDLRTRQIQPTTPASCTGQRRAGDFACTTCPRLDQIAALRTSLRDADVNDPDSFSNVFAAFDISEGPDLMGASGAHRRSDHPRAGREHGAQAPRRSRAFELTMSQLLHHRPTDLFHGFFAGRTVSNT